MNTKDKRKWLAAQGTYLKSEFGISVWRTNGTGLLFKYDPKDASDVLYDQVKRELYGRIFDIMETNDEYAR